MTSTSISFSYVRENPRISYVQPEDAWVTQKLVSGLEVLFGRNRIERIYHDLKAKPFNSDTFFEDCLTYADIQPDFDPQQWGG